MAEEHNWLHLEIEFQPLYTLLENYLASGSLAPAQLLDQGDLFVADINHAFPLLNL